MGKLIYNKENRLIYQESMPGKKSPIHNPDANFNSIPDEEEQETRGESKEQRLEKEKQKIVSKLQQMSQLVAIKGNNLTESILDPTNQNKDKINEWRDEGADSFKDFEGDFDDLDDGIAHFDQEFGIEGLGEVVRKICAKKDLNEIGDPTDYQIIAKLSTGISNLGEIAIKKQLEQTDKSKNIDWTIEDLEDSENTKNLAKIALFDLILLKLKEEDKKNVVGEMINMHIKGLPINTQAMVIRDMYDRGVLNQKEYEEIIAKYKKTSPEFAKKLEEIKSKKGQAAWEEARKKLERQLKGNPDQVPSINIRVNPIIKDPESTDANYAASMMSLKNIILYEYVGSLMAIGAALEIGQGVVGGIMGKSKEERASAWKSMLTSPALAFKLGTLGAITENITSERQGKMFGEGVFSQMLGLTESAKAADAISEKMMDPENAKYTELDYLIMKKLADSENDYYRVLGTFGPQKTEKDINALRSKFKKTNLSVEQIQDVKLALEGESVENEKMKDIMEKLELEKNTELIEALSKRSNSSPEEINKLINKLIGPSDPLAEIVGVNPSFLNKIDTTIETESDPLKKLEKKDHIFNFLENIAKKGQYANHTTFYNRIWGSFKGKHKNKEHYVAKGDGDVVPNLTPKLDEEETE